MRVVSRQPDPGAAKIIFTSEQPAIKVQGIQMRKSVLLLFSISFLMFSRFGFWDDEGYLMATIRAMLQGHRDRPDFR